MKYLKKICAVVLVAALFVTTAPFFVNEQVPADVVGPEGRFYVSKDSKVKYKLKKGILTIYGNGKMPKGMHFAGNANIKKVIIKKGVTSVSNYAFYNCKNLKSVKMTNTVKEIGWYSFYGTGIKSIVVPKKVKSIGNAAFGKCNLLRHITIPGNFTIKQKGGDEEPQNIMWGAKLASVKFNTKLDLNIVQYCQSRNLYVMKNDSNYTSIDGVIYSKDGKCIVRMPLKRKELVIAEGCTEFALSSITYAMDVSDSGAEAVCTGLNKIVIPESVEKISDDKYNTINDAGSLVVEDITIQSKKLDTDGIMTLITTLETGDDMDGEKKSVDIESILSQLQYIIKKTDNMYISKDGILIRYVGNEKEVVIPDSVKVIAENAFESDYFYADKVLEKVTIPEGVIKIDDKAFAYRKGLKEANLPKSLEYIGEGIFYENSVEKLVVPSGIKVIEEAAFDHAGVMEVVIEEGITTIPKSMFNMCFNLKKITIPKSVTKIEDEAFLFCDKLDISTLLVGTNVKEIGSSAFYDTIGDSIIIPSTVEKIGRGAFGRYSFGKKAKTRTILVEGKTDKFNANSFTTKKTVITYNDDTTVMISALDITKVKSLNKGTKSQVSIRWAKVTNADGYEIQFATNKKFTKNVKKVKAGKNTTEKTVKLNYRAKTLQYARIRPYKTVEGKKVYGRWTVTTD